MCSLILSFIRDMFMSHSPKYRCRHPRQYKRLKFKYNKKSHIISPAVSRIVTWWCGLTSWKITAVGIMIYTIFQPGADYVLCTLCRHSFGKSAALVGWSGSGVNIYEIDGIFYFGFCFSIYSKKWLFLYVYFRTRFYLIRFIFSFKQLDIFSCRY